jgi:hypothetical protein
MKTALHSFAHDLDQALRGNLTTAEALRAGRIAISESRLIQASLILGVLYGICMGTFPILRDTVGGWPQLLSTVFKVPLLFLLTLAVTLPSLYVFSALAGSRLHLRDTTRLLVIAIAVDLAVLAGLGPVTAFFVFCTESYQFIKLLNVIMFAVAGVISLVFLRRALDNVFTEVAADGTAGDDPSSDSAPVAAVADQPPAVARRGQRAQTIFRVWIVVYGVVGAQMGWVLRPFLGSPDLPFQLFRERQSSFFHDLLRTIGDLFS